jgi:hypothetical protein
MTEPHTHTSSLRRHLFLLLFLLLFVLAVYFSLSLCVVGLSCAHTFHAFLSSFCLFLLFFYVGI